MKYLNVVRTITMVRCTRTFAFYNECYLVVWEEENSVSVVSASNVAKGNGADVGECCDVVYKRKNYLGRVAAKGSNY